MKIINKFTGATFSSPNLHLVDGFYYEDFSCIQDYGSSCRGFRVPCCDWKETPQPEAPRAPGVDVSAAVLTRGLDAILSWSSFRTGPDAVLLQAIASDMQRAWQEIQPQIK